jgi:peptidyl-dipeptidase A
MDKVAFLPFGLLVDKWRWGVFDGSISQANYNQAWTDLRLRYQGITPPSPRTEANFDPGAKFHIPGNTPYTRYFLARVLQFQFYKAACDQAGWTGTAAPLQLLRQQGSRPAAQRDAGNGGVPTVAGSAASFHRHREMSGKAMLEYFAPLQAWLKPSRTAASNAAGEPPGKKGAPEGAPLSSRSGIA